MCSTASSITLDPNSITPRMVESFCSQRKAAFTPIRVYSFDGNLELIRGVSAARDYYFDEYVLKKSKANPYFLFEDKVPQSRLPDFKNNNKLHLKSFWTLEHAAFMEEYFPGKTVEFSLGQGETGRVNPVQFAEKLPEKKKQLLGPVKTAVVPVLTVDAIMEREKISHVDVLKMDVEGHDGKVLAGGKRLIENAQATVIIFEYNIIWEGTLQYYVQELLEKNGYACYVEGKNSLLKLTHGCWTSQMELKRWSNIWCTSLKSAQGVAIATIFDSYVLAFSFNA